MNYASYLGIYISYMREILSKCDGNIKILKYVEK